MTSSRFVGFAAKFTCTEMASFSTVQECTANTFLHPNSICLSLQSFVKKKLERLGARFSFGFSAAQHYFHPALLANKSNWLAVALSAGCTVDAL